MEATNHFPRLFTVDEANGLLPTLRPLMEQIFQNLERLKSESESVIRNEGITPESPDFMDKLQHDDGIARVIKDVREAVEEINNQGCVCKGVEQGLVDFPCVLGEEVVFLCWRYGEEQVGHWHRIEDGFAGRKPLLDSDVNRGTSYH